MLKNIVIKLNDEVLINIKISNKDRLLLIVDESYQYPETLLNDTIKGILNLLKHYYWDDFNNLSIWRRIYINPSDLLTGELDISLKFEYKGNDIEYFFNILESKCIMESVSMNGKPAYFIENTLGNRFNCENFSEYRKISKLADNYFPSYYRGSNLLISDKLFYKLIFDIITDGKAISEYNDRVKKIYKELIPKLDLGISKVEIGEYGATYYVGAGKSEYKMPLTSLGSGMNTLAKSLPQAIDAIVNNKIYVLNTDGLDSIHPVLSKALIGLFKRFKRGKLIMPSWSISLDFLNYYNLKESNILKLRSETPETLIFE